MNKYTIIIFSVLRNNGILRDKCSYAPKKLTNTTKKFNNTLKKINKLPLTVIRKKYCMKTPKKLTNTLFYLKKILFNKTQIRNLFIFTMFLLYFCYLLKIEYYYACKYIVKKFFYSFLCDLDFFTFVGFFF